MESFLKLVKPKIALIGVGKSNAFGHPNECVLDRLTDLRYKNL
jgi:beta-lactamase superfamily II metal-dependent hydrolase